MADLRGMRNHEVFLTLKRDLALVSLSTKKPFFLCFYSFFFVFLLVFFFFFFFTLRVINMFLFFIIIIFLHFMLLFLWQVVQATHKVEEII